MLTALRYSQARAWSRRGSDYQRWKFERYLPYRGYCGLAGQTPAPPTIKEASQ